MRPSSLHPRLALVLVVSLAIAHALAHAMVRPLYQVSDEVVYFSTVQQAALARAPHLSQCIAPPDGRVPSLDTGTKPGFRHVTAAELVVLCHVTNNSVAALRAVQALSAGVVAGCAWALGLLLTRNRAVALLAGCLVGAHPVAATHAGAVTPDAWANAFSAVAFLCATRLLVDRARWPDVPVLLGATLAAFAWKDTTAFLLTVPLLVVASHVVGRDLFSRRPWLLAASVTLAVPFMMAGLAWFETPYLRMAELYGPGLPWADAARVAAADLTRQAPGFIASSITGLGNFGASALTLPGAATAVGVLLAIAALGGLMFRHPVTPVLPSPAVVGTWGVAAALCLAQPSVRLSLLGTQDIHQGRWLLPLLAPASVLMAIGLLRWGRRGLPLWTVAAVMVAWSGLLETARYFWERFPSSPDPAALFLRGTGGMTIDDDRILAAISHSLESLPAAVPVLSLVLVVILSAASIGLTARFVRPGHHP